MPIQVSNPKLLRMLSKLSLTASFCFLFNNAWAQQDLNSIIQDDGPTASRPINGDGSDVEQWIIDSNPLANLSVISVRPIAEDTCQQVMFEFRQTERNGVVPVADQPLHIDPAKLCLLGLRNNSDTRTLLVKVGERFGTVSVPSDSRIYLGIALAPGQEILVPIRMQDVERWDFPVQALWEDQRDLSQPGSAPPAEFEIILGKTE